MKRNDNQLAYLKKKFDHIDDALDYFQVEWPGSREEEDDPLPDWWGVSTDDDGIIAYFSEEKLALRFRLDLINHAFNGDKE